MSEIDFEELKRAEKWNVEVEMSDLPVSLHIGGERVQAQRTTTVSAYGYKDDPPSRRWKDLSEMVPGARPTPARAGQAMVARRWVVLETASDSVVLVGQRAEYHPWSKNHNPEVVLTALTYHAPRSVSDGFRKYPEGASEEYARSTSLVEYLQSRLLIRLQSEKQYEEESDWQVFDANEAAVEIGSYFGQHWNAVERALGDDKLRYCAVLAAACAMDEGEPEAHTGDTLDNAKLRVVLLMSTGWGESIRVLAEVHCSGVNLRAASPASLARTILQDIPAEDGPWGCVKHVWLCDPATSPEVLVVAKPLLANSQPPFYRMGPPTAASNEMTPSVLDFDWGRKFFADWSL